MQVHRFQRYIEGFLPLSFPIAGVQAPSVPLFVPLFLSSLLRVFSWSFQAGRRQVGRGGVQNPRTILLEWLTQSPTTSPIGSEVIRAPCSCFARLREKAQGAYRAANLKNKRNQMSRKS